MIHTCTFFTIRLMYLFNDNLDKYLNITDNKHILTWTQVVAIRRWVCLTVEQTHRRTWNAKALVYFRYCAIVVIHAIRCGVAGNCPFGPVSV